METGEHLEPLGHVSLDRYTAGSWASVLLERMLYWLYRTHKGGRLLDLGCGEGALLIKAALPGIGVDLNPERLAMARRDGVVSVHADGNHLPFADQSFSTVISMEVLEHVPDMASMIREVYRVLEPGGRWIVSVPGVTLFSLHEMRHEGGAIYCDDKEHFREFSAVNIPWFKHRFMSIFALERMLSQHGFSVRQRDGLFYQFPQWFLPWAFFQKAFETTFAHRFFSHVPYLRNFPYWHIRVLKRRP